MFDPQTSKPLSTPIEINEAKARAKNSYILEYNWEDCVEAYQRRFPNHPRIRVMKDSFILSQDITDKVERISRRVRIDIEAPPAIKKALALSTFNFIQETTIDRKKRIFRLNSVNEFLIGRLEIYENVIMEPWNPEKQMIDYQNGIHCRFSQIASFKLPGFIPFAGQIEKIAMKNYQRNMSKGKYIDTKFILEMLAERKGIYLNLSRYKGQKFQIGLALSLLPSFLILIFWRFIFRNILFYDNFLVSFKFVFFLFLFLNAIFLAIFNPFEKIVTKYLNLPSKTIHTANGLMAAASLVNNAAISPKLLDSIGFRKDIFDFLCTHLKPSSSTNEITAGLGRLAQLKGVMPVQQKNPESSFSVNATYSLSIAAYKSKIPPPPPEDHFPPKLLNFLIIKIENQKEKFLICKTVRSFIHLWLKVKNLLKKSPIDGADFLSELNFSSWNYSKLESFEIFLHKDQMASPSKYFQMEYLRFFADIFLSKISHDLICIFRESEIQHKVIRKLFSFFCIDDGVVTSRPISFEIQPMLLKASRRRGSSFPRSLPILGVVSVLINTNHWREFFFSFSESIPFLFLSSAQEGGRFLIDFAYSLGNGSTLVAKKLATTLPFEGGVYQLLYPNSNLLEKKNVPIISQLLLAFSRISYAELFTTTIISLHGTVTDSAEAVQKSVSDIEDSTALKTPLTKVLELSHFLSPVLYQCDDEMSMKPFNLEGYRRILNEKFPPYCLGKPSKMYVVLNRPLNMTTVQGVQHHQINPLSLSKELLDSLLLLISSALSSNDELYDSNKIQEQKNAAKNFSDKLILLRFIDLVPLFNPNSGLDVQFSWSSKERITFWLNIFNLLLLHQQYFLSYSLGPLHLAYDIGGFVFSVMSIKVALIGKNRYLESQRKFMKISGSDPRRFLLSINDDHDNRNGTNRNTSTKGLYELVFLLFLSPSDGNLPCSFSTEDFDTELFQDQNTKIHSNIMQLLQDRVRLKSPINTTNDIHEKPIVLIDKSLYPYFLYVEATSTSYYSSSKWHKRFFLKKLLRFLSVDLISQLKKSKVLKYKPNESLQSKWISRPLSIVKYFSTRPNSSVDSSQSVSDTSSIVSEISSNDNNDHNPNDNQNEEIEKLDTQADKLSISSKIKLKFADLDCPI